MHGSMGAGWKRGFGHRASRLPYQELPASRYPFLSISVSAVLAGVEA
jgi:hypothetical protein